VVFSDLYGSGDRGVVLAHGMRFDKGSWKEQAIQLADAGYLVLAIDFRGYGKSHAGPKSRSPPITETVFSPPSHRYLAAARTSRYSSSYGASMGGGASANAVVNAPPGTIDRLVLLVHAPIQNAGRLIGPKLFATAKGDPITPRVLQYAEAPEPKQLLTLDGNAHAQFLFTSD